VKYLKEQGSELKVPPESFVLCTRKLVAVWKTRLFEAKRDETTGRLEKRRYL